MKEILAKMSEQEVEERRTEARQKKTTISLDDFANAHVDAIIALAERDPMYLAIIDKAAKISALAASILFDDKED